MSGFTQVVDFNEHDNTEIKRAILPRTEMQYDRALSIFERFRELHPQALDPPDIQTYKAFIDFFARNTKGRLEGRPTVGTVEAFRRDFEAGMSLIWGYNIPETASTTLREWITQGLKKKLKLSTAEMDKDGLSPNNLTMLMTQLWCRDFKEYQGQPPDRSCVQISAAMLLYCFTSARTGEVHESTACRSLAREQRTDSTDKELEAWVLAACYKHFHLTIESISGTALLVLTYQREYIKGYWRKQHWELPVHAFYDVYKETMPLFLNFIMFFLPMASADKIFQDYPSTANILNAVDNYDKDCPAVNKVLEVIRFKPDALNTPVFRQFNELAVGKSTGKTRCADAFGKAFVELGHRSGYVRNVTVRACQRWALIEADKKYSKTARMKFAAHSNPHTFGRSYTHPVSEVDGPAIYLGIASRHEHIQNRRGMGMYHNAQLWQSLPAKAEFEFQEQSDVIDLDNAMEALSLRLSQDDCHEKRCETQLEQHRVYNRKQQLYMEELKHLQASQSNRPESDQQSRLHEETLFCNRRRVMRAGKQRQDIKNHWSK